MKTHWERLSKKLVFLFAALSLVFTAACGSSTTSNGTSEAGEAKDLTIALGAEPKTLDPQDATDNISYDATNLIYDNLVTFNEKMEIIPWLAKSWKISDDQKKWTFTLQEGVKFHDGTPFNAEAVKTNFERVINKDNKLARYSLYAPYIEKLTADSEYEVTFHLKQPFGPLLYSLAHPSGAILSPKAIQEKGKEIGKGPVGTGPFVFKEWVPGDSLTVEANPNYWGEKPKVKSVIIKPIVENSSRTLMLETGEVDIAFPVPALDVDRLKNNDKVKVATYPSTRVMYIGMNMNKAPFNNVKFRQAINYAVDKESIVTNILKGNAKVSESAIGQATSGYTAVGAYPYDKEKAKQLLKEAGVAEGTTIKLWTPEGRYPMDRQTAEFVQNSLQEIGLKVELRKWEWGSYLDAVKDPNSGMEMFLLGWAASTNDADWALRPLFMTGDSNNYGQYSNPEIDKLLEAGMLTTNEEERKKIYADALKMIKEEAPWLFLHELTQPIGVYGNVEGVNVLSTEIIDVRKAVKK